MYLKLLKTMNNNFETELQKTIALFEIMQKNLDYKTEIKVYKAPYFKLLNSNGNKNKLNVVKVSLLHNYNFSYENGYNSILNAIFAIYIKEDLKNVITKSFDDLNPKQHPSYEGLKKMYKMLFDAQNSCI